MQAVIIEDELLVAEQLQHKISRVAADVQVIDVLPSLKVARQWLAAHAQPDLMFMDIQLSDGISFELFDQFALKCPCIFVTAYDEYALRAFRVNGIDYLLKPVDSEDLKRGIDKARAMIQAVGSTSATMGDFMRTIQAPDRPGKLYKEKFVVNVRRNWVPIPVEQIAMFIKDSVIYIHTVEGERFVTDYVTLDEIEDLLDPRLFYRANRQTIIHINNIRSIRPLENQKLVLTLKSPPNMQQDVSREKAPAFKRWWDR